MASKNSVKGVVLMVQLGFLGLCVLLGIYLWISGVRPASTPEMRVTVTAQEKYENCIKEASQQPDALQENALMTCSEVNWTDTLEPVSP